MSQVASIVEAVMLQSILFRENRADSEIRCAVSSEKNGFAVAVEAFGILRLVKRLLSGLRRTMRFWGGRTGRAFPGKLRHGAPKLRGFPGKARFRTPFRSVHFLVCAR